MTLSEKLKKLRKEKAISRKEAAEKSGISIASYSAYEDGKRTPKRNPEYYDKLAELYGVSADYLKDDSQGDEPPVLPETKKRTPKKKKETAVQVELQYGEYAVNLDNVLAKAREVGAANIYIKPEENAVYYVAGEESGSLDLF